MELRMASISKPPIPLKMYKHFAVVTLVMTASIAMFADDGNRQAVANHIDEREQQQRLQRASQEMTGPPRLIGADEVRNQGSFGDEGGSYGAPAMTPAGGGDGGFGSTAAGTSRISVPGYDQAWIDSLSEEEYQSFLASLPPEVRSQGSEAERAAAFQRAAARRSGHSGGSADAPS